MKIIDISLPISSDLPVWPGDPPIAIERMQSMDEGAHANVSRITASVHTGTHVDAPHHFLNNHQTVESLPLEILTGPAWVIRIPDEADIINKTVLDQAGIPADAVRLLMRSRNSTIWQNGSKSFSPDFVGISANGAEWLVDHHIQLVGMDYLSVAPYKNSIPTHQILLKAGVVVLEGIDLSRASPGRYDLYCLPLNLVGSDGAPARAILVK